MTQTLSPLIDQIFNDPDKLSEGEIPALIRTRVDPRTTRSELNSKSVIWHEAKGEVFKCLFKYHKICIPIGCIFVKYSQNNVQITAP